MTTRLDPREAPNFSDFIENGGAAHYCWPVLEDWDSSQTTMAADRAATCAH